MSQDISITSAMQTVFRQKIMYLKVFSEVSIEQIISAIYFHLHQQAFGSYIEHFLKKKNVHPVLSKCSRPNSVYMNNLRKSNPKKSR